MIVAIDARSPGYRDAEHLALAAGEVLGPVPPDLVVSTHPVRVGPPHAAATLTWGDDGADPAVLADRVRRALPVPTAVVASRGGTAAPAAAGEPSAVDGALVALALRTLGRDGRWSASPAPGG